MLLLAAHPQLSRLHCREFGEGGGADGESALGDPYRAVLMLGAAAFFIVTQGRVEGHQPMG